MRVTPTAVVSSKLAFRLFAIPFSSSLRPKHRHPTRHSRATPSLSNARSVTSFSRLLNEHSHEQRRLQVRALPLPIDRGSPTPPNCLLCFRPGIAPSGTSSESAPIPPLRIPSYFRLVPSTNDASGLKPYSHEYLLRRLCILARYYYARHVLSAATAYYKTDCRSYGHSELRIQVSYISGILL